MSGFSQRVVRTPPSPIRKLVPLADQAKSRGIKVYHLNIGDPDIITPRVMLNALKGFPERIIRYANSQGEKVLLEALLGYYHHLGFTDLSTENLIVTSGGSEAILWSMLALADEGDEIIVFEPFYANYAGFASMSGIKLVPVTTKIENGFHLPRDSEIRQKITSKTKAILICNPSNPTGTIYRQEEIKMLGKIAKEHDLFLMADEVYREFCYGSQRAISLLTLTDLKGRVIVLDSLSKRYSLCGARLGCLVSHNKELIGQVLKFGQARLSVGLVDQAMASALVDLPDNFFEKTKKEYQARRDLVVEELKKIPGVKFAVPEGAFYLIAKLPVDDAEKFASWLLTDFSDQKETVMVAPAAGFYATPGLGKQEIRIAYVINQKDLKRAMEILEKAISAYQ